MLKNSKGNITAEYSICLVFILIFLIAGNGVFGDGSVFMIMKSSYDLFMNKFNATILNLDIIP